MADSIEVQMAKILEQYSQEVQDIADETIKDVAKQSAKKLRDSSPRGSGDYAHGWTSKKTDVHGYVVYNKTKPGLTHLLENGHIIANQFRKGMGRTPGIKHIKPVEEWASAELTEEIERRLP